MGDEKREPPSQGGPPTVLRCREDRSFTILQFTDIHFKNGNGRDRVTLEIMNEALDAVQPDLVVLTGDIIHGDVLKGDQQLECLSIIGGLMERRSVHWAAVFGNHDDGAGSAPCSKEQMLEVLQSGKFGLTLRGPEDITGVGNFHLPVLSSRSDAVSHLLYFIDSGTIAQDPPAGPGGYAWVESDQIRWFTSEAKRLNSAHRTDGRPVPSLLFLHIPLPEYQTVWEMGITKGNKKETICCPRRNTGLFSSLPPAGVEGVFCGHDHVNDFEGTLEGVRLCYGRVTGWPDDNRISTKGMFTRGARVIQLREGEREFSTWLRLQGGEVVHQSQGPASQRPCAVA